MCVSVCLWVERTSSGSQRSLYCWSLRAPPFKWLPFPLSSPLLEQKLELREPSAVNLPLMLVQSAAAGNLVLVKKILKETKMAINTSDPEGRTALHEAIAHGMRVCCREVDGVAHTHKDRETDKTDRHTHTLTLTHTHTHTHTHSLSLSLKTLKPHVRRFTAPAQLPPAKSRVWNYFFWLFLVKGKSEGGRRLVASITASSSSSSCCAFVLL